MGDPRTYHDGLISEGYAPEEALRFTVQYYPDFQLAPARPPKAPPTPRSAPRTEEPRSVLDYLRRAWRRNPMLVLLIGGVNVIGGVLVVLLRWA